MAQRDNKSRWAVMNRVGFAELAFSKAVAEVPVWKLERKGVGRGQ